MSACVDIPAFDYARHGALHIDIHTPDAVTDRKKGDVELQYRRYHNVLPSTKCHADLAPMLTEFHDPRGQTSSIDFMEPRVKSTHHRIHVLWTRAQLRESSGFLYSSSELSRSALV